MSLTDWSHCALGPSVAGWLLAGNAGLRPHVSMSNCPLRQPLMEADIFTSSLSSSFHCAVWAGNGETWQSEAEASPPSCFLAAPGSMAPTFTETKRNRVLSLTDDRRWDSWSCHFVPRGMQPNGVQEARLLPTLHGPRGGALYQASPTRGPRPHVSSDPSCQLSWPHLRPLSGL